MPVPEDAGSHTGHSFSLWGKPVATEPLFTLLLKLPRRQILVKTKAMSQRSVPGDEVIARVEDKRKGKGTVVVSHCRGG